jgi:hypothetical protein
MATIAVATGLATACLRLFGETNQVYFRLRFYERPNGCSLPRSVNRQELPMVKVVYEVVEHDGGWAYKVGDVLSESFPTHKQAHEAAAAAAGRQQVAGKAEGIEYEDAGGKWHQELAKGEDRPQTELDDKE